MRPLELVLEAVGPFPGEVRVDFRRLTEAGLFLIHGPTGAGKSTLMDGLTFALFGESSGGEREAHHLRSRAAPPERPTRVELLFQVGPRCYRALRQPAHERPRKRGEGVVLEPQQARLFRLEGGREELLARRWPEVTARVEEILGMKADQFRKVMVLPQGQFRRLLSADTGEREEVLRRLLDTHRFERVEKELQQLARGQEKELALATQHLQALLGHAGVADRGELTARREALDRAYAEAQAAARAGTAALRRARQEAEQARERQRLAKLAATAAREEEGLAREEEARREEARRLAAARRAERLVTPIELERTATAEEARLATEYRRGKQRSAELERAEEGAAAALEEAVEQRPEGEKWRRRRDRLAALRPDLAEVDRLTREQRPARARMTELHRHLEAVTAQLEQEEKSLHQTGRAAGELAAALEEQAQARREREGLEQEGRGLAQAAERATRLDTARQELARLEEQRQELAGRAEWAAAQARQRERDFLQGRAGSLAGALRPGAPCPVCGSTHHPEPAPAAPDEPTEEEVAAARREAEEARRALAESGSGAARLEGEVRALTAALAELLPGVPAGEIPALLARRRREVDRRLEAALAREQEGTQAVARARAGQERLASLGEMVESLRGNRERIREELATLERQEADRDGALRELHRRLHDSCPDLAGLDRELRELGKRLTALEEKEASARQEVERIGKARSSLAGAQEQLAGQLRAAKEKAAAATGRLAAALAEQDFAHREEAQGAMLAPEQARHLEESHRHWEGALRSARERAARAATEAEAAGTGPDPEPLVRRLQELEEEQVRADRLVGERKEACQALARLDREVAAAAVTEAEAAAAARLSSRVAQVAAGRQGEEGMSFHRFVLAAMLEEVVQAAGWRFDRMSRGRYRFERAREREKRRRKGGLDLNVFDAWNGRSRPVATLSGGEGFLAALALTLGLAEIVHNRVGGTRMEALFIDEGFGSLDQEALDAALVALQDLREAERLVGVISHVPELCERIPVRLEVVKRTDRSTLNHIP